jgi:hypothetical protein
MRSLFFLIPIISDAATLPADISGVGLTESRSPRLPNA